MNPEDPALPVPPLVADPTPEPTANPRAQPTPDAQFGPSDETLRGWLSELADGQADPACSQASCTAWRERADMRQTWHSIHLIGDVLRSDELARPPHHDAEFLRRLHAKLVLEPVVMAPAGAANIADDTRESMDTARRWKAPADMAAACAPSVSHESASADAWPLNGDVMADAAATAARTAKADSFTLLAARGPQPARRRPRWLAPAAVAAGFVAVAGVLLVTRLSGPGPAADAEGVLARSGGADEVRQLATTGGAAGPATWQVSAAAASAAMIRDAELDAYLRAHQAVRSGGAAFLPGAGLRSVDVVVPAAAGR